MKPTLRILLVILIVLSGVGLRLWMAQNFPAEWDEDDYLAAAAEFRRGIEAGDLTILSNSTINWEHPPLVKLLYALALDPAELDQFPLRVPRFTREPQPPNSLMTTRAQSVAFGGLTLLVAALVTPLGALALAFESIHVHFSSVAYLDALPVLLTLLCAVSYNLALSERRRPQVRVRREWAWMAVSGVSLGLAVACKYPYAVMGAAVSVHLLLAPLLYGRHPDRAAPWWTLRERLLRGLVWGVIALSAFLLANPYLWPDPAGRLAGQITYFRNYAEDRLDEYRPLLPLEQLVTPQDHLRHLLSEAQITPFEVGDWALALLAIPGALLLLWRGSVYGWWLLIGLVFLMLWPTQWIQHKMLIVVPFSFAAAAPLQLVYQWITRRLMPAQEGRLHVQG